MDAPLGGKVAVVTGAGSGIGRAIALDLAGAGAAVCVAELDDRGEETADLIRAAGRGAALYVQTDVAAPESVRAMTEQTVRRFDRLDILVNNAGLQYVAPIVDYPEET